MWWEGRGLGLQMARQRWGGRWGKMEGDILVPLPLPGDKEDRALSGEQPGRGSEKRT